MCTFTSWCSTAYMPATRKGAFASTLRLRPSHASSRPWSHACTSAQSLGWRATATSKPCHGRLRMLGEVTDPAAICLVLEGLGLPTQPPRVAHARDPTELLGEPHMD